MNERYLLTIALLAALAFAGAAAGQSAELPPPSTTILTAEPGPGEAKGASPLAGLGDLGGMGGVGGGRGGGGGGMAPGIGYRSTWLPTQRVTNQPGRELGFTEQDLSFSAPLWSDGSSTVVTGRVSVREQLFQGDALLPNSPTRFPDQFWSISAGVTAIHKFDNGWVGGLSVSGGSASNKPFATFSDLNANVLGFVRVPASNERDAWMFSLFYSPLGQVAFPIPGVSYQWRPSDEFTMNIGLPFQMHYRPVEDLSLDFSYMVLTTVNARATYRLTESLRVFGGFEWTNQSYRLSTDTITTNRFFYYEKRLATGLRYSFTKRSSFELSTGYAFDRFYSQGKAFSDEGDRVEINSGPYIAGQLHLRW